MFSRRNDQQNRHIEIHEKPDIEEISGGIGNNAINQLPGFQISGSNDADKSALNAIPDEIVENGLENYYQNDLNNFKWKTRNFGAIRKKHKNDIPLIQDKDDLLKISGNIIKNQESDDDHSNRGMREKDYSDDEDSKSNNDISLLIKNESESDDDSEKSIISDISRSSGRKKQKNSSPKLSEKKRSSPKR